MLPGEMIACIVFRQCHDHSVHRRLPGSHDHIWLGVPRSIDQWFSAGQHREHQEWSTCGMVAAQTVSRFCDITKLNVTCPCRRTFAERVFNLRTTYHGLPAEQGVTDEYRRELSPRDVAAGLLSPEPFAELVDECRDRFSIRPRLCYFDADITRPLLNLPTPAFARRRRRPKHLATTAIHATYGNVAPK